MHEVLVRDVIAVLHVAAGLHAANHRIDHRYLGGDPAELLPNRRHRDDADRLGEAVRDPSQEPDLNPNFALF